jgi:uncharacterized protein YndB with AHSA1/START domain
MSQLFVEESIEIDAPTYQVWEVLTNPDLTCEWARTWWPDLVSVESSWQRDSAVDWKIGDEVIAATGVVTASKERELLQYTFKVADASIKKQETVTCSLQEVGGMTQLSVRVGNFADSAEHKQCYPGAVESWKKSLLKIKSLAEELE